MEKTDATKWPSLRADKARKILAENYEAAPGEVRTNIVDMLADIRHLCDAAGVDFYEACDDSYQHYLAERNGEE